MPVVSGPLAAHCIAMLQFATSTASASAGLETPSGNSTHGSPAVQATTKFNVATMPGASNSALRASSSETSNIEKATATSAANLEGGFWAGADFGTLVRMEAIPGRLFYDFDSKMIKDPVKTLGDSGVNAARVESTRGQCLGPSNFVNNALTLGDAWILAALIVKSRPHNAP